MREAKVVGFKPNNSAAPPGRETFPLELLKSGNDRFAFLPLQLVSSDGRRFCHRLAIRD